MQTQISVTVRFHGVNASKHRRAALRGILSRSTNTEKKPKKRERRKIIYLSSESGRKSFTRKMKHAI